jgi:hypothetical protein
MVHASSLEEIRSKFGTHTPRRQFLFGRLQAVIHRLRLAGDAKRIYLFGSFVTGKDSPNDVETCSLSWVWISRRVA